MSIGWLITEIFAFFLESVNSGSIKKCTQAAEFNINVETEFFFSIIPSSVYTIHCIVKLAVATTFAVELVSRMYCEIEVEKNGAYA